MIVGGGAARLSQLRDVDTTGMADGQTIVKAGDSFVPGDVGVAPPAFSVLDNASIAETVLATTRAVPLPAHEEGDFLVAVGYRDDSGTITPPNGWATLVSAGNSRHHVFTRTAGSSILTTENFTSNSARVAIVVQAFAGEDLAAVLLSQGTTSGAAVADATPYETVLYGWGNYTGTQPAPTGLVQLASVANTSSNPRVGLYRSLFGATSLPAATLTAATTNVVVGITSGA